MRLPNEGEHGVGKLLGLPLMDQAAERTPKP